jgi:hypothetical protein
MTPVVMNDLDFSLFGGYWALVAVVLLLFGSNEKPSAAQKE